MYHVYIMASRNDGALYIGFTNDLSRRVTQHRESDKGHTHKYNIKYLVYYESHSDVNMAIEREKQIKRWKREWKIRLIEKENPEWRDLSLEL